MQWAEPPALRNFHPNGIGWVVTNVYLYASWSLWNPWRMEKGFYLPSAWVERTLSLSMHLLPLDIFRKAELPLGPCTYPATRRVPWGEVEIPVSTSELSTWPCLLPAAGYLDLPWILFLISGALSWKSPTNDNTDWRGTSSVPFTPVRILTPLCLLVGCQQTLAFFS